jgi:hypothetical protein
MDHAMVGAWKVAVDVPGARPGLVNLALLTAEGTVLVAVPSPTPAAPGAGHRLEFWTPALGSWAAQGEREAVMTFVALGADENGAPAGTHTITAAVTADADGQGWRGPFQIAIAGPDGAVGGTIAGTVTATRIAAESPAT